MQALVLNILKLTSVRPSDNRLADASLGVEHLEVDKRPALRYRDVNAQFLTRSFASKVFQEHTCETTRFFNDNTVQNI